MMKMRERGMVTAETAVILPTLTLVTCILLGLLWLAGAQINTNETARFIARSMSQGQSREEARQRLEPGMRKVHIRVRESGQRLEITVTHRASIPTIPWAGVTIQGRATAAVEHDQE